MSFKSPVYLRMALAFRAVELAMRVDRVHEQVVDQRVDVALPLKEGVSADISVPPGMEDIVKAVRMLPPLGTSATAHRRAGGILGPAWTSATANLRAS